MRWGQFIAIFRRSKFKLHGGRGGLITFRDGSASGELEWEMLVGEFDMVIFGDACRWTAPVPGPMRPDEVRRLVKQVANEWSYKFKLSFGSNDEEVLPDAG